MLSTMKNSGIFHKPTLEKKTGIVFACQLGSAREVRRMLAMGCEPDETNSWNEPAVIVAAKNNNTSCVKVLLESGVPVNSISPTGKSIKDYAESHNNQDMLELVSEYENRPRPRS